MTDQKQNAPGPDQPWPRRASLQLLNVIDRRPLHVLGILMSVGLALAIISMTNSPPSLESGETDTWWAIALNLVHGRGYSLCLTSYFPFCGSTNQVTAMREPLPVFLFGVAAWLGHDSLWVAAALETLIFLAIIPTIYFLTH